jgi:hypothetical protein
VHSANETGSGGRKTLDEFRAGVEKAGSSGWELLATKASRLSAPYLPAGTIPTTIDLAASLGRLATPPGGSVQSEGGIIAVWLG